MWKHMLILCRRGQVTSMSDKGNSSYSDKGMLSSYRTSAEQFPNPEDMVIFEGYGADAADLERGYCAPTIRELPEYDKDNYNNRWTVPSQPDEDSNNREALPYDYEFRMKELKSKGFLTRPRIPNERG